MSTVSDILRHECMVLGQVDFISLRPTANIKQFTLQLIKDSALEICWSHCVSKVLTLHFLMYRMMLQFLLKLTEHQDLQRNQSISIAVLAEINVILIFSIMSPKSMLC